ncbi:hypothetical protein M1N91_02645, partial [Dehalococcoidia bacterium]|nr:hypothetical protein [Dehalococcoidia bacterium]
MNFLIQGLLNDLLQRCNRLKQELNNMANVTDEISDYWEWITKDLDRVHTQIIEIQKDPDIGLETLAKNFLHKYKRLAEHIYSLEWGPILAISRYSDRDRLPTLICQKVVEEINYPFAPPICVALSSQHYWTDPKINIIMLPVIEPFHLLGLSDLYHELGHILLFRKRIINLFYSKIDEYYNLEKEKVNKENKPPKYYEIITEAELMWKRYWALEFAADMIATYLVGSAYGWSNIRVCINLSNDLFASNPEEHHTHPADDARNEAICLMLEKIGVEEGERLKIRDTWTQFITLIGQPKPQNYNIYFPHTLLVELREFIYDQCKNIGLISYTNQSTPSSELKISSL